MMTLTQQQAFLPNQQENENKKKDRQEKEAEKETGGGLEG